MGGGARTWNQFLMNLATNYSQNFWGGVFGAAAIFVPAVLVPMKLSMLKREPRMKPEPKFLV